MVSTGASTRLRMMAVMSYKRSQPGGGSTVISPLGPLMRLAGCLRAFRPGVRWSSSVSSLGALRGERRMGVFSPSVDVSSVSRLRFFDDESGVVAGYSSSSRFTSLSCSRSGAFAAKALSDRRTRRLTVGVRAATTFWVSWDTRDVLMIRRQTAFTDVFQESPTVLASLVNPLHRVLHGLQSRVACTTCMRE